MSIKWISSTEKGVRYHEHPTRTIKVNGQVVPDRYYAIRYSIPVADASGKVNSKRVEEGLGWESDGAWDERAAARAREHIVEGRKKYGAEHFTRREKQEKLAKEKAAKKAEQITLVEFWEQDYLPHLKARLPKERSRRQEVNHFERRIKPTMGNKPMREIKYSDAVKMLTKMAADGLKERTQQYAMGTLFRIWDYAAKNELVSGERNPAKGHKISVSNQRTRSLDPDELKDILTHLAVLNPAAHDITFFCAFTGCRFSEAAQLTWKNVDLEDGAAHFPRTKNEESRTAYLVPQVVALLQERKKKAKGGIVFVRDNGAPFAQPPHSFETVAKNLGLNADRGEYDRVTFHTLRHTAATRAARSTNFKDMQVIFGWKTPAMVFRYAHGEKESQKEAMANIAARLTGETGKIIDFAEKKKAASR